ncbi:hypothetical protein CWC10_14795, partial [Pseudoalteromonas sp. S3173]
IYILLRVVRFSCVGKTFKPKSHTNRMLLCINSFTALLALLDLQIILGLGVRFILTLFGMFTNFVADS